MRGWLAAIAKERAVERQIAAYRELSAVLAWYGQQIIAPFNANAALQFEAIRLVRIGTMDKKIAAIALAHNALLLTANARDFGQVPGLRFADWTT